MSATTSEMATARVAPAPAKKPQTPASGTAPIRRQLRGATYEEGAALLSPAGRTASREKQRGPDGASGRVSGPPEAPAPHPTATPGDFGMVTRDVDLAGAGGAKVALKSGDAVEVVRCDGETLTVRAFSGHGGVQGTVPADAFAPQPRLAQKDDKSGPDDHVFKQYEGELFLAKKDAAGVEKKAPRVEDVDQGSLGDCYLLAAMGAVVASRPDIIQDMVSYDPGTKQYTVTFQRLEGGTFKPVAVTVDGFLPTRAGTSRLAYAVNDQNFDPKNQALWPAIIEKAYAKWKGGYDRIVGGSGARAMEEITGVRSDYEAIPPVQDVIPTFEKWQKDKKAVVCGTKDFVQQNSKTGLFSGSGVGPYKAALPDVDGAPAELVKNSVEVTDKGGKGGRARDDGQGAMTGDAVQAGTVTYENGAVSLTYKDDRKPAQAGDLEARYRYEGLISSALNLHGDHAYIFQEVRDGKLLFHNPWGPAVPKQPKPVSPADFVAFFETVGVNSPVPQAGRR